MNTYKSVSIFLLILAMSLIVVTSTLAMREAPVTDTYTPASAEMILLENESQATTLVEMLPFSLPQVLQDHLAGAEPSPQILSADYVRVTDDLETISMQVPSHWREIETGPWLIRGNRQGIFIAASPNLERYYASANEPGVFFGVSRDLAGTQKVSNPKYGLNPAILKLLSDEKGKRQGRCRDAGRFPYRDSFYGGRYDLYLDCVDGKEREMVVVSMPAHQEFIALVQITIASDADLEAAMRILDTYQVLNSSLEDDHHEHP